MLTLVTRPDLQAPPPLAPPRAQRRAHPPLDRAAAVKDLWAVKADVIDSLYHRPRLTETGARPR